MLLQFEVSLGKQDLAKKGDIVTIVLQSPGKVLKATKTTSKNCDPITEESSNNSVNFSVSAAQDAADFIRIVDNHTTNISKPRNSVTIKRKINKIFSAKINIKHT